MIDTTMLGVAHRSTVKQTIAEFKDTVPLEPAPTATASCLTASVSDSAAAAETCGRASAHVREQQGCADQ